jgi:hypothetical protein
VTFVGRPLKNATSTYDVNTVSSRRYNTALHDVIWCAQVTSLHWSCYDGDTAAVVDVVYECDNMQDSDGLTAMHYACADGHLDVVKVLLSVFADTGITDDDGVTPVIGLMCDCDCPELAHYIKHNHPMHVSYEDENDSNITVSGHVDHKNTDTQ